MSCYPFAPPKNYWANTSGNDLIRRLLKKANLTTKNEVEELLNGGQITKRIKQELTYCEIDDSIENVWSVLYSTGYLTGMHEKEAACGEALKQIGEKKYAEGLKRRGTKKIIKYGIAFCEKECMVVMA